MLAHKESDILKNVKKYARTVLSAERYNHCVRTAQTAALLCEHYNENTDSGLFAGFAHDICKDADDKTLINIAMQDGLPISEIEQKKPKLLHGRAAAIILQSNFGVQDKDILQAVRVHTFGSKNMCNLAKIIYIADKIEPKRTHMGMIKANELLQMTLDELLLFTLTQTVKYRKKKNSEIFPESLWFCDTEKNIATDFCI
ncbi:MAG: bis(5'-nucleosyl)-tetraphosphatase (symmetrical) YqeK [Spirochaetales bacterium]